MSCNEKDRRTLLIFKKGIIDHFGRLSTWSSEEDCCAWKGVHCDNITGRVTKLDLSPPYEENQYKSLEGEINFVFLELEFLTYVDLRENEFNMIRIQPIHYNVTCNQKKYTSKLRNLDLSWNAYDIHIDNLRRFSELSSLKYLNLNGVDLHKETDWLQVFSMFPSLSKLHLKDCNLNYISPSLKYMNITSLETLDISLNNFNFELPKGLFNLTKDISYLDFSSSKIHGEIPLSLSNLANLTYLDLSYNQLKGSIPSWIGQLGHLQHIDFSYNMFLGSIPSTLGNLSSLVSLYIGSNFFSGVISEKTFSKLLNLKDLDLSNSTFASHFDPKWNPPFQLNRLSLANTKQISNFPSWIYTQKSLQVLDLSNVGISSTDGNKFMSFAGGISNLHLSNNSISGDISNVTLNSSYMSIDRNNFTGELPHISSKAELIDLSYNSFSGSVPRDWDNMKYLIYINLWSNRLSGEALIHLSNLKRLRVINLGKNQFSGMIPINLPQKLQVIILRDNQFEGNIPAQVFNLSSLFHLDLAHNNLSGSIPQSVYNMTPMIIGTINYIAGFRLNLFTKGEEYEFESYFLRQTVDLSANNLYGEIPLELFRLIQVQTLNLSHNNLSGTIPEMIKGMKNLESLDLSNNKFSGEIPQSMSFLTFLSFLNLSCNDFIGRIPLGTQLQSFDASSYNGNRELCGAPLKKCVIEEDPTRTNPSMENEDEDSIRESLYLGLGVGFAVGFWGICGLLFLVNKWKHRFLDRVIDKLYVTLMAKKSCSNKT
jgi:Leucine-rich repeat (LRR) protein